MEKKIINFLYNDKMLFFWEKKSNFVFYFYVMIKFLNLFCKILKIFLEYVLDK